MENTEKTMRTHVVSDTETQQTITIQSSATTIGELKKDMRAAGLKTEGKTISEGITGVEFTSDDSILPGEVTYKGKKRTGLVFRMTTAHKKIQSGTMTRAEICQEIKSRGLENTVKEETGKNFTQVSTTTLIEILSKATKPCKKCKKEKKDNVNVIKTLDTVIESLSAIKAALLLDKIEDADSTNDYTDDEIDEILSNM